MFPVDFSDLLKLLRQIVNINPNISEKEKETINGSCGSWSRAKIEAYLNSRYFASLTEDQYLYIASQIMNEPFTDSILAEKILYANLDKTLEYWSPFNEKDEAFEPITEDFEAVAEELTKLFDKKQKDYGSKNISDFGEFGVLVRVNDKINRLKKLLKPSGETAPQNESLEDTWKDIAVYGIIALLIRRGKWN